MKKNIKFFIGLLVGIIISGISVYAATVMKADKISYKDTDVDSALNQLYDIANASYNMTNEARKFLSITDHDISLNDILTSTSIYNDATLMNKIIANSDITSSIFSNNEAIKALDNTNPIVSTDTSKAFASSEYAGWPASKAFDNDSTSYWSVGAGISYKNQYLGYDFTSPVWVYKMVISTNNGKQNTDYVLEASNDNSNYTIIKDGLHQPGATVTVIPDNYNQKYRYYRIRMLSEVAQSGNGNTIVKDLRFYAK